MAQPQLNLGQLRTFVAAAENSSFAAAADAVHLSQAAVSMQIMKLEASIGQQLFVRHTRRVTLTLAGETFLPYARRLLQIESEAIAALTTQDIKGRVVLGAPDDYMSALLAPVLEKFSKMFLHVEVELVCAPSTSLAPMLRKGSVDLAFVTRSEELDGIFIRREPMIWVGSAKHTAWKKSPLPLALYEPGCVARTNTLAAIEKSSKPYRAAYSSPSLAGILAIVEAGIAVAALTECSAPAHLVRLGKAEGLPSIKHLDIVLVQGRKSRSPAVEHLANEIVANLGAQEKNC